MGQEIILVQKNFGVKNNYWVKIIFGRNRVKQIFRVNFFFILGQINFRKKKLFSLPKKFFSEKSFGYKQFSGPKKIIGKKNWGSKKFEVKTNFWVK